MHSKKEYLIILKKTSRMIITKQNYKLKRIIGLFEEKNRMIYLSNKVKESNHNSNINWDNCSQRNSGMTENIE